MKCFVLLLSFIHSLIAFAQSDLLVSLDQNQYYPQRKGLSDLVVEMTDPLLVQRINEQMYLGKVQPLTFKFYWTADPERVDVEVIGMPEGFIEVKQQIKSMVIGKFEHIVPILIEKKFKGYTPRPHPKSPGAISLVDVTQTKMIPEYHLLTGPNGQLKQITMLKPVGTGLILFNQEIKDWSAGKWVTLKRINQSIDNGIKVDAFSEYVYESVKGIPLVKKVKTKTVISSTLSAKAKQQTEVEELTFSDFKVNEGAALRWFLPK